MIVQLNPPLPLETPKGAGLAHFIIDYGPEGDLLWVVFMDEDGACWSVPNPEVRMSFNWSMGRRKTSPNEGHASSTHSPLATPTTGTGGQVHRVFPRASDS